MVDCDLVAALRDYASWDQFRGGCQGCAMEDAALEIERLRGQVEEARASALEEAAVAAEAADRSGREWVADSLWANMKADTATAIRALARKDG